MSSYPASHEWVRNTKTGTLGWVVCRYHRTNDGKAIVEVISVGQAKNAHWLASHIEAE
jgi:hypothetical protein